MAQGEQKNQKNHQSDNKTQSLSNSWQYSTVPPRSDLIKGEITITVTWSSPVWGLLKANDSCLTQRTQPHANPGQLKRAFWGLGHSMGLADTFSWLLSGPPSSSAQSSFLAFTRWCRAWDTSFILISVSSWLSCKATSHNAYNYHFPNRLFLSIFCKLFPLILINFWWSQSSC